MQFQQENILAANDFEEEFDTVIIAEVIEHLFHPRKAVLKAVHRLKQDGHLLRSLLFLTVLPRSKNYAHV